MKCIDCVLINRCKYDGIVCTISNDSDYILPENDCIRNSERIAKLREQDPKPAELLRAIAVGFEVGEADTKYKTRIINRIRNLVGE